MSKKYVIRFLKNDQYELVEEFSGEVVTTGTLAEINTWLELKNKGFEL